MKDQELLQPDNVQFEQKAQEAKKMKFLLEKPLKKGQKLFEFNFKENTIREYRFANGKTISFEKAKSGEPVKKIKMGITNNGKIGMQVVGREQKKMVIDENDLTNQKRIILQPNCIYIPSINFANAIRLIHNKIQKGLNPTIIKE